MIKISDILKQQLNAALEDTKSITIKRESEMKDFHIKIERLVHFQNSIIKLF